MKKQILIVENDRLLQQILLQALQPHYHCATSASVAQSYDLLEHQAFDAVVLDRVLDDGDGMELITHLNEYAYPTHILIISMLKDWQDKVRGLQLGADDYLPKPFAVPELLVRLEHMLAHQKQSPKQALVAGPYTLLVDQGLVEFGPHRIQLRKKEALILGCLMTHRNRTISRSTIIQHVWRIDSSAPQLDTLEVYIRRLRVSLKDMGAHIKTVRGFGYRFDV